MPAAQLIYLDTNIFIAQIEGPEETSRALKRFFNAATIFEHVSLHTSSLCFAELFVLPYKKGDADLVGLYSRLLTHTASLHVHSVNSIILDTAAVIRTNGRLKLPDAIHLATASAAGCQYFLTFDKDFVDLGAIPHPIFEDSVLSPVNIVHPDPASLSELAKAVAL